MSVTDALIIGAGPFGLSISAHLHDLGVDHVIVGRTMDTWRTHMPAGMNLKSEPYASVIASPKRGSDIAAYSAAHGLDYVDRVGPLPLTQFLGYADWFAEKFVPDVRDLTVTKVTADGDEFKVEFAEAEPIGNSAPCGHDPVLGWGCRFQNSGRSRQARVADPA